VLVVSEKVPHSSGKFDKYLCQNFNPLYKLVHISKIPRLFMDLRPYQREAVDAVLDTADRCVVKMFCGTGKSRVIVTVVLREGKSMSVVVFPSLALVQQFSTDYVMGLYVDQFADYLVLNVSSEKLVDVQSTTDARQIQKFCEQTNPKLILVTYQSLEVLLANLGGRTLDLICYDEAHHVVSLECQQLVFFNESIPATTKQVFFTATPRNANGVTMQDREDPENNWCGPVVCDYPYLAALDDDWLNSFDVCIDMYTEQSNRSVYTALARAILTRRTSRVLSFHSAVNGDNATSVWNFVDPTAFQVAWDQVCLDEFPALVGVYRSITFVGMDGATSTADRQRLLHQLDATSDDDVFILSSCETIGEGVDTKRANLCLFADPKSSSTKIIQNIGRVVRRNAQCPVSTVLIPCFVNLDDYKGADRAKQDELIRENMRSAKGDNAMILNVLAALKQEDPDLYDMCLNCRPPTSSGASDPLSESEPFSDSDSVSDQPQTRESARQVGLSIHRSTDIGMLWGIDGSLDFTRKFCSVVISCEVSLGLDRWREKLALVKQYLTTHQKAPSNSSTNTETKNLASWINTQKQQYTKNAFIMSKPAIRKEWESTLADPAYGSYLKHKDKQGWRDQLVLVKQYLTTHQQAPSSKSKNPDTKSLGYWIANQKTNYAKNSQIMSNPATRQEWENTLADPVYGSYLKSNEQVWRDQLALVKQYLTTHQQAPSTISKNTKTLALWIGTQKQQYTKNTQIMSNPAIRQEWESTLADPAYGSYLKHTDNEQGWRNQLALVKQYLTTHQQAPSYTSKNPDTKSLASWIVAQKQKYDKNAQIMSNPAIRQEWESTLADPIYGSYLKPNEQAWRDQLSLVKQYLTTHRQAPSQHSKDPGTKTLGHWISNQKTNYAKSAQIMSNPTIRQEWESTLADPAYGSYLMKHKRKPSLTDPTEKPPSPPKKVKLVHPPKAYADLTEQERRHICEKHLLKKASGYQSTNPDTKDQINGIWADSCCTGTVVFLDHIEFRTAYALLARGVLPENMLIPQRAEHFAVMSQHELFGSSVVLAEFNDVVASCLANGTLLAGVYADYCCTMEKAALPLLQLLSSSKLQPGFVLGVTITLRNPEGVRFAGQDITTVERVLTKNWPASSNLLLLAGVTPDDNGPLTYGAGAPMATWLLRL
jgi:superfamily II DNA or RNA helicase